MLHMLYLRLFRKKSCACLILSEQTTDSGLNKTTMLQYISDKDSLLSISLTLFQMNPVMNFLNIFYTEAQFSYLLFGCPTTNFGRLSRGQPHSPDLNHYVIQVLTRRLPGTW